VFTKAISRLKERPLAALTLIALVPRLLASFFSGGYFAHDDHFLIIESSASWVQAAKYSTWLPWNQVREPQPSGHSFFYVGIHYLLFQFFEWLRFTDPKAQMIIVRLIHALWSLIVVRMGYLIALRLSDREIAWPAGLFLALFYFMPFLSVRNLVEVVCIPFLMLGAYQLIRDPEGPAGKAALIAGIWIGMSMNIRFQTIFFAAGPGLAFLFQRQFKQMFLYGFGLVIPLIVIQGSLDMLIWKKPFVEIAEYVRYNLENTTTYGTLPWYNYLLLLLGIFIPPFSIALFFGFFRRTTPLTLWLAILLFLAIHSYFPNKQERFLLPMIPLFFILAYVSWEQWRLRSSWWQQRQRLWKGIVLFIWCINIPVMLVLSIGYSKRSRVEAMDILKDRPVNGLVVEDSFEGDPPLPPLYYMRRWHMEVIMWSDKNADLDSAFTRLPTHNWPNVVLFFGEEELEQRKERLERVMGPLRIEAKAEPGLVDKVVHWLNPVNRNETIVIARTAGTAQVTY
jgi:hypothetical protein